MSEIRQFFWVTPQAGGGLALAGEHGELRLLKGKAGKPKRFTAWDCFGGSIRASGQLLLESGSKLFLIGPGHILQQSGKRGGNFLDDLREGPVKAALAGVFPFRCLLPVAEGALIRSRYPAVWRQKACGTLECWAFSVPAGPAALVGLQCEANPDGQAIADQLARHGAVPARPADAYARLAPHRPAYSLKPPVPLTPEQPAAEAAAAIIRSCLGVARQNEPGIISDLDTEFLHDYRISLRRIRSALTLFKGVFTPEETRRLKQVFSNLMAATSRLRDLDVCLLQRPRFYAQVPQALHSGLDSMFAAFAAEREHCHRQLALHLAGARRKWQFAALQAEFAEGTVPAAGPRGQLPALEFARKLIWKRYGKVRRIAGGITPATPDDEVHKLRVCCKRLRYLIELFAPLFPARELRPLLKPLKKLQNTLGEFNDCAVQQAALLKFAAGAEATRESALSAGALIAVLHEKQLAARVKAEARIAAFNSLETHSRFQALYRG